MTVTYTLTLWQEIALGAGWIFLPLWLLQIKAYRNAARDRDEAEKELTKYVGVGGQWTRDVLSAMLINERKKREKAEASEREATAAHQEAHRKLKDAELRCAGLKLTIDRLEGDKKELSKGNDRLSETCTNLLRQKLRLEGELKKPVKPAKTAKNTVAKKVPKKSEKPVAGNKKRK